MAIEIAIYISYYIYSQNFMHILPVCYQIHSWHEYMIYFFNFCQGPDLLCIFANVTSV